MEGNSQLSSLEQEAVDEGTTGDRLRELAQISIELARLVAKNSSAPPELLQELSASSDVIIRKNVAANPNTPTEILLNLGTEFPEQMLENPLFSLLLLENPNLVNEMPLPTLQSILKLKQVPIFFLEQAANKQEWEVQLAVTMNPNTPQSALERLAAANRYSSVARNIAEHPNTTGSVLEKLAEHENDECHYFIAKHPKTPSNVLARLAETLITKWQTNLGLFRTIAKHPNTPVSTLEFLAKEDRTKGIDSLRVAVAENSNTPLKILEKLAQDKDYWVRRAVALHPNTTERLLMQIAMSQVSTWERRILPPDMSLEQVAVEITQHLLCVQQPNTSVDVFEQFVAHRWDAVRLAIAMNQNAPEHILDKLSKDQEFIIRIRVAENPNTPIAIRQRLTQDGNWIVRAAASDNLPSRFHEKLCDYIEFSVRAAASDNLQSRSQQP